MRMRDGSVRQPEVCRSRIGATSSLRSRRRGIVLSMEPADAPKLTSMRDDVRLVDPEDLLDPEWAEWYGLTPAARWEESEKLWATYLTLGGRLDPEPDTQSPFGDPGEWCGMPADGGTGLRLVRRSGV